MVVRRCATSRKLSSYLSSMSRVPGSINSMPHASAPPSWQPPMKVC
jgi:hypothetical protein